jgi:hypothetical protein
MPEEREYDFTSKRVVQLMNIAIVALSGNDLIGRGDKGELLDLLVKLRREESARLLEKEKANVQV